MAKKKTTEEFKKEVYDLVGNEYEVLGEYVNTNTKIEIEHSKCGHIYRVTPNKFLIGRRCPECSKKIVAQKNTKTTEEFKKEVHNLVGDEYTVLGKYIDSKTRIEMRHNECGNIYLVVPASFLRGHKCPECSIKARAKKRAKTTEEFKKEVYDLVGDEYEVLGEYINTKTNIVMTHNRCGYIYGVAPGSFLAGSRCTKCFGTKQKTTEEFKKEVYDLVGDEYEVLGEYINSSTKVEIVHNKCGCIYTVRRIDFLRGHRCPRCFGSLKKTTEEFKKEVYDLVGDEYEVLGEYIGNKEYIKIKHHKCGYIYDVSPNSFLRGKRCFECYGAKKKTTEEFKKEVYDLVGNEYDVLGEYANNRTYITMTHNRCGYIYGVAPGSFLAGSRCPKCFGTKQKTTEEFKKEVYDLVNNEYEVLSEYTGSKECVKILHNNCGNIYSVRPNNFLRGNRCPKCSSSKGEHAIIYFLNKYKINYKHDKSYGGCSYEAPLRFDFLIFDNEQNLKLICEFDGIQHFEPVDIFGGEEGFKETQERDRVKNDFCKDNGILLVRIPYWEIDNIPKILGKKLYKLGLIDNK